VPDTKARPCSSGSARASRRRFHRSGTHRAGGSSARCGTRRLLYVWDDVASTLDPDFVTDVHAEIREFVLIVEAGPRHRHAPHLYRGEQRHRGESPRPSDLDDDVLNVGRLGPGRDLVAVGPPVGSPTLKREPSGER